MILQNEEFQTKILKFVKHCINDVNKTGKELPEGGGWWFFPSARHLWYHIWRTESNSGPLSIRGIWTYWRESPPEGHQGAEGSGVPLWGEVERAGPAELGATDPPWDLINIYTYGDLNIYKYLKYLKRGCSVKVELGSFQWRAVPKQDAVGTNWKTGGSFCAPGSSAVMCGCWSTGTGCLEAMESSPRHGPGPPALGVPGWTGMGLDDSKGLFQPQPLCDSVKSQIFEVYSTWRS